MMAGPRPFMSTVREIPGRRQRIADPGGAEEGSRCFVCRKPFERGEGRYRLKEGDAP